MVMALAQAPLGKRHVSSSSAVGSVSVGLSRIELWSRLMAELNQNQAGTSLPTAYVRALLLHMTPMQHRGAIGIAGILREAWWSPFNPLQRVPFLGAVGTIGK